VGEPGFATSFALGGFPDNDLADLELTNRGVLRGYAQDRFRGRHLAAASVELRLPLAHPQRGWRSFPIFLRHVHAALFADAGEAWTGTFAARDVKVGVGAALGGDFVVFHVVPLTGTVGVARGLAAEGETKVYVRAGLSF
jgi:hypothetical protein